MTCVLVRAAPQVLPAAILRTVFRELTLGALLPPVFSNECTLTGQCVHCRARPAGLPNGGLLTRRSVRWNAAVGPARW